MHHSTAASNFICGDGRVAYLATEMSFFAPSMKQSRLKKICPRDQWTKPPEPTGLSQTNSSTFLLNSPFSSLLLTDHPHLERTNNPGTSKPVALLPAVRRRNLRPPWTRPTPRTCPLRYRHAPCPAPSQARSSFPPGKTSSSFLAQPSPTPQAGLLSPPSTASVTRISPPVVSSSS